MTLGEWIPAFIDAYKRDTIRPDSLYTVQLVASKIPSEILAMELDEIRPMHLQRFVNAFALTASKSYMKPRQSTACAPSPFCRSWPIGSSVCPIRENFCSVRRTVRFFIPGILPGTMMHSFVSCGKRCPLCVTCPPTAAATPSPP